MMMKIIKDLNKWRDGFWSGIGILNMIQMVILSK